MAASTPKRSRKKTHLRGRERKSMLGRSPATKSPSKNKSAKRGRGRPRKRAEEKSDAAQINVAFSQELLRAMDAWIAEQPDRAVRPEAIRRLVIAALELTRPKRSAAPKEPHFEPSLEQIEAHRSVPRRHRAEPRRCDLTSCRCRTAARQNRQHGLIEDGDVDPRRGD